MDRPLSGNHLRNLTTQKLHEATINYINDLIKIVYNRVINLNPENTLQDDILDAINNQMTEKYENVKLKNLNLDIFVDDLAKDIISTIEQNTYQNDLILPWDVLLSLQAELKAGLYGYNNDPRLVVYFTVNGKGYDMSLTKDQALGILLYQLISDNDFMLEIMDEPLDNIFEDYNTQYTEPNEEYSQYKMTLINDKEYYFNNPEFLQGFATGALWTNTDPHVYIKYIGNLTEYEDYEPVTF